MANYNTSEHAGFIRGGAGRLIANAPVDTGDVRDSAINNLNHLEDSACQHLVNINGRTAGKAYWDSVASTSFGRALLLPPIPVALRVLPSGDSARIVIRMRGMTTSAGTATWRFALRPIGFDVLPPPAASASAPHVCELSTTSTTVVELGPASLYVPAVALSDLWTEVPSMDGSGELGSASVLFGQLEVWASSSGAGVPRLFALTAREWIA